MTQGFKDPQPLSYQDNGWGASGGGFEYWWLLGYIEVHSALQRKTAHSSGIADPSAYGSTTTPDSAGGRQSSINSLEPSELIIQL